MIKKLLIVFAFVATIVAAGTAFAQTATTAPTSTTAPTTTVAPTSIPNAAPNTGFDPMGQ